MLKDLLRKAFHKLGGKSKKRESDLAEIQKSKIEKIEALLGYSITQPVYFIKAISHRSFVELHPELEKSNERLEFLGDAVLGMVVAEHLFHKFPAKEEGDLTKIRSYMVNRDSLAEIAKRLKLYDIVLYDKRYINKSHEGLKTISSDTVESLIGAIYLDGGLEKAKKFISKWVLKPSFENGDFLRDTNYKGQLLEFTHAQGKTTPYYRIINEEGPGHNKVFTAEVTIGDDSFGVGKGKNKKSAEQEAAKNALEKLNLLDENQVS